MKTANRKYPGNFTKIRIHTLQQDQSSSSFPLYSIPQRQMISTNIGPPTNVMLDRIKYAGLSFGKQSEIAFELFLVDNCSIA